MTDLAEGQIQLPPDSTGKPLRTVQSQNDQGAGLQTVHQQVMALAGPDGRLWEDEKAWRAAVIEQQHRTNQLLEMLLGALS